MSFDLNFCIQFSTTQYFHEVLLRNQSVRLECIKIDHCQIVLRRKILQSIQIDGIVLYAVRILKAEFWHTTLQRHLTTFETDFRAVTRARSCSFVTTCRCTTTTGTLSTSNTFSCFCRTSCWS